AQRSRVPRGADQPRLHCRGGSRRVLGLPAGPARRAGLHLRRALPGVGRAAGGSAAAGGGPLRAGGALDVKVVIAGELPLAEAVLALGAEPGHETSLYLVETLRDADTAARLAGEAALADVAVECHNESKAAKRRLIEQLAGAAALYVSALACSATEAASWAEL